MHHKNYDWVCVCVSVYGIGSSDSYDNRTETLHNAIMWIRERKKWGICVQKAQKCGNVKIRVDVSEGT